jgi:hypothetical protein
MQPIALLKDGWFFFEENLFADEPSVCYLFTVVGIGNEGCCPTR